MGRYFKLDRSGALQFLFFFFLTILIIQNLDRFQQIKEPGLIQSVPLPSQPFAPLQETKSMDDSDSAALLLSPVDRLRNQSDHKKSILH